MFAIRETGEVLIHEFDKSEAPMFCTASRIWQILGKHEDAEFLFYFEGDVGRMLSSVDEPWISFDSLDVFRLAALLDIGKSVESLCEAESEDRLGHKYIVRSEFAGVVGSGYPRVAWEGPAGRLSMENAVFWAGHVRDFFLHVLSTNRSLVWYDPDCETAESIDWETRRWIWRGV